ncbi:MAG: septum formation protein Maf, partial [Candidatus Woesebacteria bacterium GW2011_GWB1_38_8]
MRKIILASTSPRRKELLEQIGLEFLIEPSGYEEDMNQKMSPEELARFLSHQKALDVAEKHKGEDSLVIGADTFIAFEGGVLGKPHTAEKAKE